MKMTFFIQWRFIALSLIICFYLRVGFSQEIKVACIGDSVTFGTGISNRDSLSYPSQLQRALGERYQVGNFGKNGATLLYQGHNPYLLSEEFKASLEFVPDIAVIHLGLNDTDPRNWSKHQLDFESDYAALIDSLHAINPAMRILIAELTPIFSGHPRFKSGTRDWHKEIRVKIHEVAQDNEVELVDFYSPLHSRPDLFPDQLHPTAEGANILANTIYQKLTGDFGGFQLDRVFQNGAVLQRELPHRIYGGGDAGKLVSVNFAGVKSSTKVDTDGQWVIEIPPLEPGGPYSLKVAYGEDTIRIDSMWVGDVWLAMGQSNMDWSLMKSGVRLDSNQFLPRVLKYRPAVPMDANLWGEADLNSVQNLQFMEGEWLASKESLEEMSAVAFYFASKVGEMTQIPIGIVQVSLGGAPLEAFVSRESLENSDLLVDMLAEWKTSDFIMPWVRQRAKENLGEAFNTLQRHPFEPAYLHEAVIHQLRRYPAKGMIWYQGESNAHNWSLYEKMFPLFINDNRKHRGQDFPFYMVQLPGLSRQEWPFFREIQERLASELPDLYLISALDQGDSLDVHPRDKKEVGVRLAHKALAETYKLVEFKNNPPRLLRIEKLDSVFVLEFEASGPLRSIDHMEIQGFELIGEKGKRLDVPAKIDKNKIHLPVPSEMVVKEIWYNFQPFPSTHLTDDSGLPVFPFRHIVK